MQSFVPVDELAFHCDFLKQVEQHFDRLSPMVVENLEKLRGEFRWEHEFYYNDHPALNNAWRSAIEDALSRGVVDCPQPCDPGPPPEPRYHPADNEMPARVGRDLFPIYAADPLSEAHTLIDDCWIEAADLAGPEDFSPDAGSFKLAFSTRGQQRGGLLTALVRRQEWFDWQYNHALPAQLLFKTRFEVRRLAEVNDLLWDPLFEKHTAPTPEQLCDIFIPRLKPGQGSGAGFGWDNEVLADLVGRSIETHGLTEGVTESLLAWKRQLDSEHQYIGGPSRDEVDGLTLALDKLLGTAPAFPLNRGEAWSDAAIEELTALPTEQQSAWAALLEHAGTADGGKPKPKWAKAALPLIDAVGGPATLSRSTAPWFELSPKPRAVQAPAARVMMDYDPRLLFDTVNARCLKGLAWCLGITDQSDQAPALRQLALAGLAPIPGRGPKDTKLTNAAVWALAQFTGTDGVAQLSVLKTKVKHKPTLKGISKAFDEASEREGVARHEIEEVAVPTYGLTGVGIRRETVGEYTAELVVTGTTTELRWIKPDGKPQKSVPKAVKDEHGETLKNLKAAAKDIQKLLPAQRDRLDQTHLRQQTWPYPTWAERYLHHPLVGTLGRRVIWSFDAGSENGTLAATWLDGRLVDAAGEPVEIAPDTAVVSLWHPIGRDEADVLAWRVFFEQREIRQPFKQAHREVYLLTDAERNTTIYSNRYAAHLVKQHQFNALCAVRGWKNQLRLLVDADYEPATLELPAWGLRAEFWVDGAGDEFGEDTNDIGTFHYLATDQVRFYQIDAAPNASGPAGGGYNMAAAGPGAGNINEPVPIDLIDPLVFSEVMRDVDLFVGVASVGNDPAWEDGGRTNRYGHDGYWQSYSFGDLSGTATTRKQILERLIPRLKIADRCSFSEKFLVVRGDVRTYKIHLGSGNILMEPNDQYLCIVPGRGAVKGPAAKVFLPFEGDRTMSIILSKAFLLAADTKITDATILSQIRR